MGIMKLLVRPSATRSRLIRSQEAAEYLGTSEWKLRKLVLKGEMPVHQNGGPWMFDVRDLDAYIEKWKTTTPAPAGVSEKGLRHHADKEATG